MTRLRSLAATVSCAVLGTACVSAAAADVFKCADNDGRITYQDQPCAPSAGGLLRSDADRVDPRRAAAAADVLSRMRRNVAEMEQARRSGENAAEIAAVQRELASYDTLERDELAPLQQEQRNADSNAIAAVWDRAALKERIAKDMQAITDKYASKRQAARERIAQLQKQSAPTAASR